MVVSNSDIYLQETVKSTFMQKIHPNKFLVTFFVVKQRNGPDVVVKKMAGPRPSRIMSHTALPWTAKRTILRLVNTELSFSEFACDGENVARNSPYWLSWFVRIIRMACRKNIMNHNLYKYIYIYTPPKKKTCPQ